MFNVFDGQPKHNNAHLKHGNYTLVCINVELVSVKCKMSEMNKKANERRWRLSEWVIHIALIPTQRRQTGCFIFITTSRAASEWDTHQNRKSDYIKRRAFYSYFPFFALNVCVRVNWSFSAVVAWLSVRLWWNRPQFESVCERQSEMTIEISVLFQEKLWFFMIHLKIALNCIQCTYSDNLCIVVNVKLKFSFESKKSIKRMEYDGWISAEYIHLSAKVKFKSEFSTFLWRWVRATNSNCCA